MQNKVLSGRRRLSLGQRQGVLKPGVALSASAGRVEADPAGPHGGLLEQDAYYAGRGSMPGAAGRQTVTTTSFQLTLMSMLQSTRSWSWVRSAIGAGPSAVTGKLALAASRSSPARSSGWVYTI